MSENDLPRTKIDGERHYVVDGDPYPSVTTVTGWSPRKKEALATWEDKVGPEKADDIRDQSALLGTVVHHRILREYAVRKLPKPEVDLGDYYPGIMQDVGTCEAMWDQLDFEIEPMPHIEERIVSHEHGYAGTFDMMTEGTVVDLKTSPAVRRSHRMQIAAYFHAIEELSEFDDPTDAAIIRLDPDPSTNETLMPHVEWLEREQLERHFDSFLELLSEYGP